MATSSLRMGAAALALVGGARLALFGMVAGAGLALHGACSASGPPTTTAPARAPGASGASSGASGASASGASSSSAASAASSGLGPAAFDAHLAALDERLDAAGARSLKRRIEGPFVILGNGSDEQLDRYVELIRRVTAQLEADFFAARPTRILDVFLFEDARSYERTVRALTGESPTTPYGFYSSAQGGLFMNVATGGGTLVHELVHPYVEADFPDAPPWLNEGLGSLFEQSATRDGHIVGLTNWRLAGLQQALAAGRAPTFEALAHLDRQGFYGAGSGTHYAEARYLLYYLQEHGLLRDFYRQARAAREADPSAYQALVSALGEPDMAKFQRHWTAYVSGLEFP